MASLYAEESIEVNASPEKLWNVLTQVQYTKQWVGAFQPVFSNLKSAWEIGSLVEWQASDGKVIVDGVVTRVSPFESLAFTVHDLSGEFDDVQSNEDGIFYTLISKTNKILLSVKQGDFSKIGTRAQEFCDETAKSWKNALPVIKQLAEQ